MSKNSEQEQKLQQQFSDAVSDIRPLHQDKIIPSSDNNRTFVPQPDYIDTEQTAYHLSDQYDPFENDQQKNDLNYHHLSVSHKQFRALKKSPFESEMILDLHGCNKQQARDELVAFLQHCNHFNYRRVAIMPGQGMGILRQSLNIWLRQIPQVLAFAESPYRDGGKGVIRILLATSAEK